MKNIEFYKGNETTEVTPLYKNVPFILEGMTYNNYLGSTLYPMNVTPTQGHVDNGIGTILTFPWTQTDTYNKWNDILELSDLDINADAADQKFAIVSYLLSVSACFVEVPKWKTTGGVKEPTYDKFICTTNPDIALKWLNSTDEKLYTKYQTKVNECNKDTHELMVLKLAYKTEDEPKVTVPRKMIKTDSIICTPMVFIDSFLNGLKTVLSNNMLRVTYLKDNNTLRVLDTTLNRDLLYSIYPNQEYVETTMSHIHILGCDNFKIPSKLARGYISVPELGASMYDFSGTRAINLTRIVKIETITAEQIDKTFVNVDLEAVPEKFKRCAFVYVTKKQPDILKQILSALQQQPINVYDGKTEVELYQILEQHIDTYNTYYGTAALRSFHLFLAQNPVWFPTYVGVRNTTTTPVQISSSQYERAKLDI